jgi:iron complex transport system substrate-binding protein
MTNTPTIEALFAADPDYVLIGGTYQNSLLKEIQGEVWANLAAVKNNNVFNIGVGYVMFEQNGVELTIYLADIANKIYPDLFHFDIHNMLKKQMQLYFNKSLSDSEVSYMLSGLNVDGQPLA